ncbi:uncharacterized protein CXQ87_000771 [Candidozyma duobushaemuli]|uniref:Protein kinase domain-containing protein n=1 Tax=Candidozyma duobushaemuli TaxID=1231522 RepID=A0A2V1AII2_9ASCO|nr:uncharacterized protein CXQ87_000771 [[Candida] duobushaemulonis]PVH17870.1 hypothetical protein CXQ87_000771 [[Candida] duobushaemulonis]
MSSDEPQIRYSMLSSNFLVIHRLGLGSFGQALLAKYKKNSSSMLAPDDSKIGTMMEPVCHSAAMPHLKPHTNGLVAIKMMKTPLKKHSDYLKITEVRFIHSMSSHINLLQIHHVFIDSLSGKLCIVMEAMNQNLYQLVQKHASRSINEEVIKSMLAQVLNGVRHIHAQGFFHRDVKPENILVTPTVQYYGGVENVPPERKDDFYMVKLCDYGLARHYSNTKDLTPYVSTRWYRAPEILLRSRCYTQPIDIWAFACVAVELVNSRPLFPGANEAEQMWHVLKCLGHPTRPDPGEEAFGGYWEEGEELAENLGLYMPSTSGSSMEKILRRPGLHQLSDMLRPCFLWNPDARPTVFDLAQHDYFKGTILEEDPLHFVTSTMTDCASPETLYSDTLVNKSSDVLQNILQQKDTGYDVVSLRAPYLAEQEVYNENLSSIFGSRNAPIDPPRLNESWAYDGTSREEEPVIELASMAPFEDVSFETDSSVNHRISC